MGEVEDKLKEWQASQSSRYIGRDGKPVLARDLEDRAERAEAQLAAMTAERDMLVGALTMLSDHWTHGHTWSGETRHETINGVERFARAALASGGSTALDHIRAQAKAEGRKEGMREAMQAVRKIIDGRIYFAASARRYDEEIYEAILAAAEKEVGK